MNIGLAYFDVPELTGGGGAERFFYDFFIDYNTYPKARHKLFLITDNLAGIEKTGRAVSVQQTILVKNYRYFNFRFLNFLNKKNGYFLGNVINAVKVRRETKKHNITKIIIPFYHPRELVFYRLLSFFKIQLDYFIVDCRLPANYHSNAGPYYFKDNYEDFFQKIKFNTIHTWYKAVKEFVTQPGIIAAYTKVENYISRYAKTRLSFDPAMKQNVIVFAARLDQQKDPFFFLEALNILQKQDPAALNGWKVKFFGHGPLSDKVKAYVRDNNLQNVELLVSGNLEDVFATSRIFVSTQMYENFPSLAITEAMSKGNIILAKNVGQTGLLVEHEKNGFLCDEGDAGSLARMIGRASALSEEAYHAMAVSSIEKMRNIHTLENFVEQFDNYVL